LVPTLIRRLASSADMLLVSAVVDIERGFVFGIMAGPGRFPEFRAC
jgi:hypothetical protein